MKMIPPLLLFIMAIIHTPALAEEECTFDQEQQRLDYLLLEKLYPGSKYIESEYKLIIPSGEQQIHLQKGGCAHYGMVIELIQPVTDKYKNEEAFFSIVTNLVKKHNQGMADSNKLKTLLNQKSWNNFSDENGMYYFVHYDDYAAFEIYQKNDGSQTIIGVSFYY